MPPLSRLAKLSRPKVKRTTVYQWAHIVLPLLLLLAMLGIRVSGSDWVEIAQFRAFDAFIRAKPRVYQDAAVRIIDIDDESLRRLGQWPWPRSLIAKLVTKLRDDGAAAVAFDVVFSEPDRMGAKEDAAFAKAIAGGRVVLGVPITERPPDRPLRFPSFALRSRSLNDDPEAHFDRYVMHMGFVLPNLEVLDKGAAGVGAFITGFEKDGVIRRVPLVMKAGKYTVPSLALEALRVAFGGRSYAVDSAVGGARSEEGGITTIRIPLPPGSDPKTFDLPTEAHGRFWLYPTLPAPERMIPAWKVLDKGFDPQKVSGCILFVGTSAAGLHDIRATAVDPVAAGVTVHANIVEQAVLRQFLERPDWGEGLEIVLMLFFGVVIILLLSRYDAVKCLPIFVAAMALSIGLPWYLFKTKGYLLDPVFPAVSTLVIYMASSIVNYLKTELSRRQVKGAFSRYMSPALVEQLAKHPEQLKLGGETREMTWHFCDIRGFTTISEQFDPHGLVQFINRFLTPMTEIILQHQGVIDKYMGDCIMAFWNAPLDDAEHARHACQAALAMHETLAELNAQWEAEAKAAGRKFIPIHIGTGLNTGTCVVGNMGSDMRFDYSVLGDEVNLASRLEGQSKTYGVNIVIGPNTRAKVADFAALELDLIKVKGKTVPVRIYALLGDAALAGDAAFKAHEELHAKMIDAYRAKRFAEARELLERCRKRDLPLKKLYDLYEHRLDAFASEAPPADWDGTFTATSK